MIERALDTLLMASVLCIGYGTIRLGAMAIKNPVQLGASFNPLQRERASSGLKAAKQHRKAAEAEATKFLATWILVCGIAFQVFHTVATAIDDVTGSWTQVVAWLGGVFLFVLTYRQGHQKAQKRKETILDAGGGWVEASFGPQQDSEG